MDSVSNSGVGGPPLVKELSRSAALLDSNSEDGKHQAAVRREVVQVLLPVHPTGVVRNADTVPFLSLVG